MGWIERSEIHHRAGFSRRPTRPARRWWISLRSIHPTLCALALAACTAAPAPEKPPATATALWETYAPATPLQRATIRACLDAGRASGKLAECYDASALCSGGAVMLSGRMFFSPTVAARACYWSRISNWEAEMQVTLAELGKLVDSDDLARSQSAWEASMLEDVGLQMNRYKGGTMEGPAGARARATAVARRVILLEEWRADAEEDRDVVADPEGPEKE